MATLQIRELAGEETYDLRRRVSADGRTDLPHVHHELDDVPGAWHLGAIDASGLVVAIASFYRVPCPYRPDAAVPVRLQFMAVDPAVQGSGLGTAVLT